MEWVINKRRKNYEQKKFTSFYFVVPDVDCVWSDWSDWSACSVTCDTGTQERSRSEETAASGDGAECEGDSTSSQECSMDDCGEWNNNDKNICHE